MLAAEMTAHPRWDEFLQFSDRNPEVFDWLLAEAHEALRRGYRLSARYLFERRRAEGPVEIRGVSADGFVLRNDFVPLYSRALIYEDPSLAPYLDTRPVKRAEGDTG